MPGALWMPSGAMHQVSMGSAKRERQVTLCEVLPVQHPRARRCKGSGRSQYSAGHNLTQSGDVYHPVCQPGNLTPVCQPGNRTLPASLATSPSLPAWRAYPVGEPGGLTLSASLAASIWFRSLVLKAVRCPRSMCASETTASISRSSPGGAAVAHHLQRSFKGGAGVHLAPVVLLPRLVPRPAPHHLLLHRAPEPEQKVLPHPAEQPSCRTPFGPASAPGSPILEAVGAESARIGMLLLQPGHNVLSCSSVGGLPRMLGFPVQQCGPMALD